MRVHQLDIENFRGVAKGTVVFPTHGLLVGPNNVGKSTVLEALDLALGPDRLCGATTIDEYGRLEREQGRVPFERLLDLILDLLRRHQALRAAYARAYPLILVDEYQDTNDKQDKLIDLLASPGQVIYLGDPEQRIYDWLKDVRADRFERLIARRGPRRIDLPVKCHRSGTSDLITYGRAVLSGASLVSRPKPSVPTSLETVAPRYLCTDGRRMVLKTCPSQPKFLVERSPLPRANTSGMSRA